MEAASLPILYAYQTVGVKQKAPPYVEGEALRTREKQVYSRSNGERISVGFLGKEQIGYPSAATCCWYALISSAQTFAGFRFPFASVIAGAGGA